MILKWRHFRVLFHDGLSTADESLEGRLPFFLVGESFGCRAAEKDGHCGCGRKAGSVDGKDGNVSELCSAH